MDKDKPIVVQDYEDFRRQVLALPKEQQARVLQKAFDLVYNQLDDKIWRTIATVIKHAKDSDLEGHGDFDIEDKELKKLSHIQDGFRRKE